LIGLTDRLINFLVGGFPPPVRGMPVINAAVRNEFEKAGITPAVIGVSALNLDRSFLVRLGRLPKVLRHGIDAGPSRLYFLYQRFRWAGAILRNVIRSSGAAAWYEAAFTPPQFCLLE